LDSKIKAILKHNHDSIPYENDMDKIEKYTCYICGSNKNCKFAWDMYNIGGDCIIEK